MPTHFTDTIRRKLKQLQFEYNRQIHHSNGRHGSSKDQCSCGIMNANEREICPKRRKWHKERLRPQIKGARSLLKALKKIPKAERKDVKAFLSNIR